MTAKNAAHMPVAFPLELWYDIPDTIKEGPM